MSTGCHLLLQGFCVWLSPLFFTKGFFFLLLVLLFNPFKSLGRMGSAPSAFLHDSAERGLRSAESVFLPLSPCPPGEVGAHYPGRGVQTFTAGPVPPTRAAELSGPACPAREDAAGGGASVPLGCTLAWRSCCTDRGGWGAPRRSPLHCLVCPGEPSFYSLPLHLPKTIGRMKREAMGSRSQVWAWS